MSQLSPAGPSPINPNDRQMILGQVVTRYRAAGWRVIGGYEYQATLIRSQPTNHVVHLVVTLFTCGFWAPIWAVIAYMNNRATSTITVAVNEYGQVGT